MKMTKTFLLSMLLACTGCTEEINTKEVYVKGDSGKFPDYGEVLAFPGAEGFGRYATGGRGGEIYRVTNLNDDGEGSFRDAVSKSDRIIVFDVAGIINLKSTLIFSKNLTIAGQTAPGDGIVLYGNRVSFTDADNLICRHLRIRMGIKGSDGKDAAGVADGENMIFDHLSVTWGRDENFSILKSATKLFSVLLASKRPLITELADKLRLKYPLLPTISPCPTMRLEAIRSIIPISCRRYPKSV